MVKLYRRWLRARDGIWGRRGSANFAARTDKFRLLKFIGLIAGRIVRVRGFEEGS
jgi:hypothetical protein